MIVEFKLGLLQCVFWTRHGGICLLSPSCQNVYKCEVKVGVLDYHT